MTEMEKTRREDSLAPVELDRLTIEEEAASMNRGKGKQLLSTLVVVGTLAAGGAFVMQELDRQQAEIERGQAVADLRGDHLEAYLQCVVKDASPVALKIDDRIHGLIEGVVERGQKRSAAAFARCGQKLSELAPALAEARVTAELTPLLGELRTAATNVTRSALELHAYLADPAKPYDFVQATALIDRLARAVTAYREHDTAFRSELNKL
jgi:hypothetical protein